MKRTLFLAVFGLFAASSAIAGPNAGGTLLLHAEQSITYTDDTDYCGQSALTDCEAAVTVSPEQNSTTVFFAVAVFPAEATPRMQGIVFGVSYDPEHLDLVDHGTCAGFELSDNGWPQTGTGTAVVFDEASTAQLTPVYWFAAEVYADTTSFALIPHPLQGRDIADDSVPAVIDTIVSYGRLGFGVTGFAPCPAGGGDGPEGPGPDSDDEEPMGGGEEESGGSGDREPQVVLAKVEKASLALPAGVVSVTLAEAMGRGDVVLAEALASALEETGVVTIALCVPSFDPIVVDRYGQTVLGVDNEPLEVPQDLSLWFRFTLDGDEVEETAARLEATPGVLVSEPNYARETLMPDDPYFTPNQWGLDNYGQYCGAPGKDINFLPAWDEGYREGYVPVRVGVIDTGIDLTHPDLPLQEQGPNLVNPGSPPTDDHPGSHGTACAGIIGMKGNNGRGGVGVASGATIVAAKAFDATGHASSDDIAEALDWLRSAGVKVVNMSYGGSGASSIEKESLQNARASGMANVAAMGNEDSGTPYYPAAFANHTLGVGAHTHVGDRWRDVDLPGWTGSTQGSNWGDHIDLIAPGGRGIMTTKRRTIGNGYFDLSPMDPVNCGSNNWFTTNGFGGTSAAAPFVAGVLASLMAYNAQIDGEDAQQVAIRTATDLQQHGVGWDDESGWGRPNLLEALELVSVPNVVERGTVAGGSVQNAGSGDFNLIGVPGLPYNYHAAFKRKEVTRTVTLSEPFVGTPSAWSRVQGSIGWRYISDGGTFIYPNENAGYAEVVSVTTTTITLRTWYYDLYTMLGQPIGLFPNDGNVAMSYTVLGYEPTSDVSDAGLEAPAMLRVWPNPAAHRAWILARPFGAGSGRGFELFSAAGRLVRSLTPSVDGQAEWDLRDDSGHRVAAGTYFVRAPGVGEHRQTKVLVVR